MRKMVLFICTHNSARSQIAEGLTNALHGDEWIAFSAGTEKTRVHPLAIKAMMKRGIDISQYQSKTIDVFVDDKFDLVVTVCDNARDTCPYFPNTGNQIHAGFTDPSMATGSENRRMISFEKTVDKIEKWLATNLNLC